MKKLFNYFVVFGFALVILAPKFPLLAVLFPPMMGLLLIFILLGFLAMFHGALSAVFRPRR